MPVEHYEIRDGQRLDVVPGDAAPTSAPTPDAAEARASAAPGATPETQAGSGEPPASPAGTPSGAEGESAPDTDDDDPPLHDDSEINAERLNRRFARLTAARRKAERQGDPTRRPNRLKRPQPRGQRDALRSLVQGPAPSPPEPRPGPTGPPQAEQYASHEDYVRATSRYEAQQLLQQERQQAHAVQAQHDLVAREQAFAATHPDYQERINTALRGKVAPHVQQALMLLPDGPAVAYALAQQDGLVQRLNTLPPPLVFAELGRLSPPPTPQTPGIPTPQATGSAPPGPAPQLPAPPTPLSGSSTGTPTSTYRDDMSQAEYKAWRARTSQLPRWQERDRG